MLTQPQTDKLNAALAPLVSDPDFATVTDISLSVTQTPSLPAPVTDVLDVPFVH